MNVTTTEDITDGMDRNIQSGINYTIESNSIDSFKTLIEFVAEILDMSVIRMSLTDFVAYARILTNSYHHARYQQKENPGLTRLSKLCIQWASARLNYILNISISFRERGVKGIDQKKQINLFYYHGFTSFSRLLYLTIKWQDLDHFRIILKEFDQVKKTHDYGYQAQNELDVLLFNPSESDAPRIKELKEVLAEERKFEDYRRHVLLGVKYWLFYLHREGKIDKDLLKSYEGNIIHTYHNPQDALNDVLLFRRLTLTDYLSWEGWMWEVKMDEDDVNNQSSLSNWLTFGFLVDRISGGGLFVNPENIDTSDPNKFRFLYDDIKEHGNFLIEHFEDWEDYLHVSDVEELKERLSNILTDLGSLKKIGLGENDKNIAEAPLSQEKIDEFKEMIGNAWYQQARIHRLFTRIGNCELIQQDDIKLMRFGQRTFFEKAKMMFTEEYHQTIYGVSQMGSVIGRSEDDGFITAVVEESTLRLEGSSMLEVLINSISKLKENGVNPTMIFIPPEYSYKDRELLDHELYESKLHEPESDEDVEFFNIGKFDGLPIYSTYSRHLRGKAIVCDFANAYSMQYKSNENWFKDHLTVNVEPVTIDQAKKKFNLNPEKWLSPSEDQVLTEEDALTLIQTSVNIEIWTLKRFLVTNKSSYVVGIVKNEVPD